MTALEYIRELAPAMAERYSGDCLAHARRIAALLRAEGREAWIGRLRHVVPHENTTFHAWLMPKHVNRENYVAWTTHYVACADGEAYDPLVGEPVDVETYGMRVFGLPIALEAVA